MAPYVYQSHSRNRRTGIALALAWAVVLGLYVGFDAALWIVALLALLTRPALADLIQNRSAGLRLDDDGVHWHSGARQATVAPGEIDKVRLDRRFDGTMRVSVVLHTGRHLRLPPESTPPPVELEAELEKRGITNERHPFSLL